MQDGNDVWDLAKVKVMLQKNVENDEQRIAISWRRYGHVYDTQTKEGGQLTGFTKVFRLATIWAFI